MAGQLVCIAASLSLFTINRQGWTGGMATHQMIASPLSPPYHVQLWSLVNAMDFKYRILPKIEIFKNKSTSFLSDDKRQLLHEYLFAFLQVLPG